MSQVLQGATVTTWPNWVDLIVVTLLITCSYNGFGRGILAEFFNLLGAVTTTSLTVNYWSLLAKWIPPLPWLGPDFTTLLIFVVLFVTVRFLVHLIVRLCCDVVKWERLHWFVQGLGLFFGGVRGAWWAGFLLVVLTGTQIPYMKAAVEDLSIVGPRLVALSRNSIETVANLFPGAGERRSLALVPAIETRPQ
jgi:uncharacterized membrane protein required for colicin V production